MTIVLGQIIGDARYLRVNVGTTEFLSRHFFAGRRLHQRGTAEKNRPSALHDDRFVGHRRHVGATGGTRAHHRRDLRNPLGRQPRLVEKNPAEVLAIGKHLVLHRQKRAARIDEIHARQPVFERNLLRPQMLLHGDRIVGAAFHRRVVGDNHHVAAGDTRNAGHDAGSRRVVFVDAEPGECRQLEERRAGIDEPIDPLAHRQLSLLAMTLDVLGAAAFSGDRELLAQLGNHLFHALAIGLKRGAVLVDVRLENLH